jgi:hypothetical protein
MAVTEFGGGTSIQIMTPDGSMQWSPAKNFDFATELQMRAFFNAGPNKNYMSAEDLSAEQAKIEVVPERSAATRSGSSKSGTV